MKRLLLLIRGLEDSSQFQKCISFLCINIRSILTEVPFQVANEGSNPTKSPDIVLNLQTVSPYTAFVLCEAKHMCKSSYKWSLRILVQMTSFFPFMFLKLYFSTELNRIHDPDPKSI